MALNQTYRSSTAGAVAVLGGGASMVALLLSIAAWGNRVVPVVMREPGLRFVACTLPLALAIGLSLLLLFLLYGCTGKSVLLTKDGLTYQHYGKVVNIAWSLMTLTRPPKGNRNPLASALVSDGTSFVRLERALFRDFDEIVQTLEERRKARSKKIKM